MPGSGNHGETPVAAAINVGLEQRELLGNHGKRGLEGQCKTHTGVFSVSQVFGVDPCLT